MFKIGQKLFKLTVLEKVGCKWKCLCDCGNTKLITTTQLKKGMSKSCGCFRKEFRRTHGHSSTAIYRAWHQMRRRCEDPKHPKFSYYGGKGVKLCQKWQTFEGFLEDMGERPTPVHTIDRIDGDGDYCKENCRWATRLEQAQNFSSNRNFSFGVRSQSLSAWARESGINMKTLQYRLDAEWPAEEIFRKPYRKSHKKKSP